ncbi:PH domain-containing protein [Novipirellula artificiosorum]|uniref:Bacterial membrane flanked domain protein n=1 Tax=Novipirellula artificiosorum TaxID=2528016 RepID=A0A5C6E5W0_9BACT|nr:PH domain-containing protein [Novipirellula artificiosorum]TWU42866.1 Bacterial membrane flanked domain protein [Novipirellula artificiosorum]
MSNSEQAKDEAGSDDSAKQHGSKQHGSDEPVSSTGTPANAEESAASKFRQHVASKQSDLDDYEPEENLWSGRYSSKAMLGSWIAMVAASIVVLMLPFFVSSFPLWLSGVLLILIWVIGVLIYAWRRLGFHYQLTTQRFIHKTGIITQRTDRIEVIDIDDVSFTQGPVQRMFGVGTIRLTGSDRTHPELSMLGISNVSEVAGLIDDIRRKERRRRSLHIESI